jgi:dTMP kinase
MAKKGKFIVFEGGEGSGKDTQIELLKPLFPDAVFTKEPGGTKLGEELRQLLLEKRDQELDALTELFLFSAARVRFMEEIVRPSLSSGRTVVSNRFALSTIAYQVYGRERPDLLEFVKAAIKQSVGEDMPDLTIVLDIDPKIGIERVKGRNQSLTRFDAESLAFHERVRQGFLKHASELGPSAVIDASMPAENVHAEVQKAIASL